MDANSDPPEDAGAATTPGVWQPQPGFEWQTQLSGSIDTSFEVAVYQIDVAASQTAFEKLQADGRRLICYFSAGSQETFREDADEIPSEALGNPLEAYPQERWLDIRHPSVLTVMQARIDSAAQRGCDAIHGANTDGILHDTGFDLDLSNQVTFNRALSDYAHGLGLAAGLSTWSPGLVEGLIHDYDFALAHGCVAEGCSGAQPFIARGRAAYVVEFGTSADAVSLCPLAQQAGLDLVIKEPDMGAYRGGCP